MDTSESTRENSESLLEHESSESSKSHNNESAHDGSSNRESSNHSDSCNLKNSQEWTERKYEFPRLKNKTTLENTGDVLYEGGLEDNDFEYKVILENLNNEEVLDNEDHSCEVEVRGIKYRIPVAIECHLCNEMMNLCLRRTRYRGQSREYPAYRCNRKGCQTFRSIRKVFGNCLPEPNEPDSNQVRRIIYQPPPPGAARSEVSHNGDFSEDDSEEFVVQRVYIPKLDRNADQSTKPPSITERMRRANQNRATVFSEFSDQLRRDIAANKRVRIRKQVEEEHQGTLFYISKELNPQEVIELQDAIIKTLISLRKIPPPMTMNDLPLFANCPYSKKAVDAGLTKSQNDFWIAFANSSQPPLPAGFIRRKDDTLIYKYPKPYDVPEILQENSPQKQANAIVNYHRRKEEQDAKRMERRHVEKKYRSWASLKREFDMAETEEHSSPKLSKTIYGNTTVIPATQSDRQHRQVTYTELRNKMVDNSEGQLTCRIRAINSERNSESMQWIGLKTTETENSDQLLQKNTNEEYQQRNHLDDAFENDTKQGFSMQDMMRTLSAPNSLRKPVSPLTKSFTSIDNANLKTLHPHSSLHEQSSMLFSDSHFLNSSNNSAYYALGNYFPPFQMSQPIDSNVLYQSRDANDEHYNCIGASEVVQTDLSTPPPFTYIHPDSGARLTDPSAYLNTFIPSPITKLPPIDFPDEASRVRRSSEPSTSTFHNNNEYNDKDSNGDCAEDDKKASINESLILHL